MQGAQPDPQRDVVAELARDVDDVSRIDAVPRILDVVCQVTGMGFAAVARVTPEHWIACAVRDDIGFGLQRGGELRVETTICHEIREQGRLVVFDDAAADARFCGHATPRLYGFRSYISVPIVLRDGTFFGTLCAIDPEPHHVDTPQTVGMFTLFAELIAYHLNARDRLVEMEGLVASRTEALAHANLALQQRVAAGDADQAALQALTQRLERVREEERTRIARELHDELGQGLTALRLDSDAARRALAKPSHQGMVRAREAIDSIATVTDTTLDAVERIISELRPAVLDALGIAAAVEWQCREFAKRTEIRTTWSADDDHDITPAAATALFRVLQEALTNVARHARASDVTVALRRDGDEVILTVADNGCGISDEVIAEPTAAGLRGMRERLRALRGSLLVTTPPGGGTQLCARCRFA